MLFSSMLTPIRLLCIMITLYGARSVPPQNCICANPRIPHILFNDTASCNDSQCSRGDNPTCNSGNVYVNGTFSFTVYNIPEEIYFIYFGCNCPGFEYNYGRGGNNGYIAAGGAGANDYQYTYHNCNDFTAGFRIDNATRCCNYCCNPTHVPPSD